MDFTEKTISSEHIFKGKVVDLRVDTVLLPDGNTATREIIKHPGGVCVVACDENKNILMVKQFRKPTEQVLLEVPAGKLEFGEKHSEAVLRELEEETGYVANRIEYLGYFYATPAYCEEKIHMYFASDLVKTKQHLDDEEFLDVLKMPYDKLYEMALTQEIIDCKTIVGILRSKKYIDEL